MLFSTVISLGLLAIVHGQYATVKSIAFTVALSQDQVVNEKEAVIYDTVISNLGNAYNSSTGVFTASLDGVYKFHFHITTKSGNEAWLELVHNDVTVVAAYAYTAFAYDSSSNSAILKLNRGDRINIRAYRESSLYGRSHEVYNSFSGQFLSKN